MSFSQNFRKQLGNFAKENLDEVEGVGELPAEEVEVIMAEPAEAVDAGIEEEVAAPIEQIEEGVDVVEEAEADASTLEDAADILEGTVGEDGEGAGVDAAGAELAELTLERICSKYGLKRHAKVAKESFGTKQGRKTATLAIAKEADEAAASLKQRVVDGLKKLLEWMKNLIKSVFDKRTILANRAKALNTQLRDAKDPVAGSKIKITTVVGAGVVDPAAALLDVQELIRGLKEVADIATRATGDGAEVDLNPKKVGGANLVIKVVDGKFSLDKSAVDGLSTQAKEVDAFSAGQSKKIVFAADAALKNLANQEASFQAAIKGISTAMATLKSATTGKEGESKVDRSAVLSRFSAVSRASGSISGTTLAIVAASLKSVEQSIAASKKAAPAAKAETAAAAK